MNTEATTPREAEAHRYNTILEQFEVNGERIPRYMFDEIINYFVWHASPNRFLKAVICNDLQGAVSAADDMNIRLLPVYAKFFYNEAPGGSYGSRSAYSDWLF